MRERLIELLKSPHKAEWLRQRGYDIGKYEEDCIETMLADFLLAEGVIVPPCKVGDMVYHIRGNNILKMPVEWFETNAYGWCACCTYPPMATFSFTFDKFGKTVFLTKEEAEKALVEREGKG